MVKVTEEIVTDGHGVSVTNMKTESLISVKHVSSFLHEMTAAM
jgi:hypothetical protein